MACCKCLALIIALVIIVGYTDKRIQVYTERAGKVGTMNIEVSRADPSSPMLSRSKGTKTGSVASHLRLTLLRPANRLTCFSLQDLRTTTFVCGVSHRSRPETSYRRSKAKEKVGWTCWMSLKGRLLGKQAGMCKFQQRRTSFRSPRAKRR